MSEASSCDPFSTSHALNTSPVPAQGGVEAVAPTALHREEDAGSPAARPESSVSTDNMAPYT
jgi:hypothetical protein